MDTPPHITLSVEEVINERWRQQIGAALETWSRLTEGELLASNGVAEKLTALIQDRYSISADDAAKRVRRFFEKLQS